MSVSITQTRAYRRAYFGLETGLSVDEAADARKRGVFGFSSSNYDRIRAVEIGIAIGIGVDFLSFSVDFDPDPDLDADSAAITRIAVSPSPLLADPLY